MVSPGVTVLLNDASCARQRGRSSMQASERGAEGLGEEVDDALPGGTRERSSRWPWRTTMTSRWPIDVPGTNADRWRARFPNVHLAQFVELDLPSQTRDGTVAAPTVALRARRGRPPDQPSSVARQRFTSPFICWEYPFLTHGCWRSVPGRCPTGQ